MSLQDLLSGLDEEQKSAVTIQVNGVVSAGAGSGKTKVLASRYAWLVMGEKFKPDEILTLTFTNKAVSEMYSRIYSYLLENAPDTLKDFHKARISTLDSFSATIARTAAARYGISPDFANDETALRDLAREAALRFVLDNRESPAIRQLLPDHKIRILAEEIFAHVVLKYSPISSPLDLDANLSTQKRELLNAWQEKGREIERLSALMADALQVLAQAKGDNKFTKDIGGILLANPPPALPDIAPLLETGDTALDSELSHGKIRDEIKEYFDYYSGVIAFRMPGKYGEAHAQVVEIFRLLKGKDGDGLYGELESIANYACNFGLCAKVFELIKKFQDEFSAKKRETSVLSFNDIAHLAVDALKEHPDIRKVYKDSLKMIMIDEFQDNNALQRDLIYLLAENCERNGKGIAAPGEMEKDRMFFVGDEKQSIYRFRGADVAVFRSLGRKEGGSIELIRNYRSRPALIAVFNSIFEKVFLPAGSGEKDFEGRQDFEAAYSPIMPPENFREDDAASHPLAHFCFLNGEELPKDDTEGIKSQDLEAAFIAEKIRDMVRKKEKIPRRIKDGTEWAECTWGDFAVLERSYTHQSTLERYFREFGIPYNTDRPSGLFNDAPVLDLRAYLRLLVHPEDRIAYAALIRSPFMRLSDLTLAVCMLSKEAEPFAEENESLIPEEDRELYRRARERYYSLRDLSQTLPVTELITKLWYEEGYRYETIWAESAQVYESLFDLFFSLASDADSRGKSLAEFIEYLEDVMKKEEKPDDKDIPGEGESGVRIMSIHKSKGLEFPVVFIYDCTHSSNIRNLAGLVNYHEKYGLIMSIPQAEELPLGGNYFRKIFLDEEKAKDTAELKRLLYVAMTRAECQLYLTFTLPRQTVKEKEEWDMADDEFSEETILRRLVQLDEKQSNRDTFLSLLAGALPGCLSSQPSVPGCALETIPVLSRAEITRNAAERSPGGKNLTMEYCCPNDSLEEHVVFDSSQTAPLARALARSQREAALAAAPFYNAAETLSEGKAGQSVLQASKLRSTGAPGGREEIPRGEENPLDKLLQRAGLDPAEFGSLVHAALEWRLDESSRKQPFIVPPKIRSRLEENLLQKVMAQAETMADNFLASELGKRCAYSGHIESEFPLVTSVVVEGKAIAIMGQMDLLFIENNETVVVDFKTDRIERPENHYGQLAAYYQAAGDVFGKPVSAWLFYLRSGRAVNVTEEVKGLSMEKLAAAALE